MPETSIASQIQRLRQQRTAPLILELDLTEGIAESRPTDPVSALLARHRPVLADVLDGLRRAGRDPRVKALVTRVGGKNIGLAVVQELRQAVAEFAGQSKITVAFAETFGEFSAGNVPYYLATAFDTIWLQPSGDLGLTGIAVERMFLRGTLDKLGADFQVDKRYEYKSAAEQFTETGFSPAAREATQRLTESVVSQVSDAIAERRRIPRDQVGGLIDGGPYLASRAKELGLIDELGYRDEVNTAVRKQVGPNPVTANLLKYQRTHALAERARTVPNPREPHVALINASGPIRRGRTGRGPTPGRGGAMGSDTIAGAIRAAAKDPHAKAILLRVNSPGGSYTASDTIWHEVVRARATGKPVVVSMGDVAGSGGYYISMAADVIVAQPGTITGSIGVITGKPVLGEALRRAGISSDLVVHGAHAAMFSTMRPFTSDEWELVGSWLDHIYDDFTAKVATGRGLTRDRVHELGRGRIWSGADARANGLVDELGGLDRAAEIARSRAGLRADAPLRTFPRPRPLERLLPAAPAETALAGLLAEAWGPVWRLALSVGLPPYGPLMLPGTWAFD